jgi:hypothetical protein
LRIADCGLRIDCEFNRQSIRHPPSAIRNPQSALSRFVDSPVRRPWVTAGDALEGLPAAADHTVPGDDGFRISAARRREAAPQPDARGDRRAGALIEVNRLDGERLRVDRERGDRNRACDEPDDGLTSDPRNRSTLE